MTESITCPSCGKTSYNPGDIQNRYCGNCHEFHDGPDEKREYRGLELIYKSASGSARQEGEDLVVRSESGKETRYRWDFKLGQYVAVDLHYANSTGGDNKK